MADKKKTKKKPKSKRVPKPKADKRERKTNW